MTTRHRLQAYHRHAERPHQVQVRLQDDCDPVSSHQTLRPGACTGDGDTTFDELVASLVTTRSMAPGTHRSECVVHP